MFYDDNDDDDEQLTKPHITSCVEYLTPYINVHVILWQNLT